MSKIKIKDANKGKFTDWARSRGMTVQQAARHVLANRNKYSATLIKRANFARNAAKWEEGGMYGGPTGEKSTAKLNVSNNRWIPLTERNFYDRAIKPYNDTLSLQQYMDVPPIDRGQFIPNDMFRVEQGKRGSTANAGYMQYYENVPKESGPPNSTTMRPVAVMPEFEGGGFMNFLKAVAPAVPVIGNVLGAGLGIIGGINNINAGKEQARKAELDRVNAIDDEQNMNQSSIINQYAAPFKFGGTFKGKKFGGAPNAEVEHNEMIMTPDGIATNMRGKKHRDGGIQVQLPDNTLILSDTVKVDKNKTAADIARPYTKKINKNKEILEKGGTYLSKNSSERNLNKYYSKVLDAYNKQEAIKNKKSTYKFQDGGPYSYSSPYDEDVLKYNASQYDGTANMLSPYAGDNPTGGPWVKDLYDAFSKDNLASVTGTQDFSTPKDRFGSILKNNMGTVGNIAESIGTLAPTIFNMTRRKPADIDERRYTNYNAGVIDKLMRNRQYDINAGLAQNEASFRASAANMRNLGAGSGKAVANLTAAQNARQFGDMALRGQKTNMENQYRGEQANMLYGLGRDDLSGRMAHDEAEAMDYATWQNFKGSGMSGLQQYLLTKRQMKNQVAQGKLLAEAIKAYSPHAPKWVPGMDEYINKQKIG